MGTIVGLGWRNRERCRNFRSTRGPLLVGSMISPLNVIRQGVGVSRRRRVREMRNEPGSLLNSRPGQDRTALAFRGRSATCSPRLVLVAGIVTVGVAQLRSRRGRVQHTAGTCNYSGGSSSGGLASELPDTLLDRHERAMTTRWHQLRAAKRWRSRSGAATRPRSL